MAGLGGGGTTAEGGITSVWIYSPNKGAPIFFAVAYAVFMLIHAWQSWHYKSWRLTGLHVACNALMVAGFITRTLGAWDPQDAIIYMVSNICVMAAPPLYELSNFYLLGRVLYFVPYHSPIHPGRVLSTFAFLSFLVELLNGVGVAWFVSPGLPDNFIDIGKALVQASLIVQLVVITLFLALATHFWVKCHKSGIRSEKVNQTFITLYLSNGLILARCIYRTTEYFALVAVDISDPDAELPHAITQEWYFYVFEATLLLINTGLISVRHPRKWLPKSTKTYLARDGVTEVEGPGYTDHRSFLATLCDPFDWMGRMNGTKSKKVNFWDNDGIPGPAVGMGGTGRSPSFYQQQQARQQQKELQHLRPDDDEFGDGGSSVGSGGRHSRQASGQHQQQPYYQDQHQYHQQNYENV